MSIYGDLKASYIRLLEEKLDSGELSLRGSDNKLIANLRVLHRSPWVHANSSFEMNCYLWKDLTFHEIVEKRLSPELRFVPIGCQQCFKVVVRPKTIEQLFELERIQIQLNLPSKCGIELRPQVFGNYGGYFYNRGLPDGLECYRIVRQAVDDSVILGPNVKVILKRACTEMEHAMGRSDQWTHNQEQIQFEIGLAQHFVDDLPSLTQSKDLKDAIRSRWIERAFDVGDETVLKFNDGKPLHPDYVTYHHFLGKTMEEINEEIQEGGNRSDPCDCQGGNCAGQEKATQERSDAGCSKEGIYGKKE